MTDATTPHSAVPRHLSRTTRAVHSAVRAITSCSCPGGARITVLHAPGEDELELARHVGSRLVAKVPDVAVSLECTHPDSVALGDGAHRCAVIDASERESTRALMAYRWEPNQPDTGQLAVSMDGVPTPVTPGVGIEIRVAQDGLDTWAVEDGHQRATLIGRAARWVEVSILEGLHLLFRDETHVGDSPALVRVVLPLNGGARRAS